jgi:hypothetical protein
MTISLIVMIRKFWYTKEANSLIVFYFRGKFPHCILEVNLTHWYTEETSTKCSKGTNKSYLTNFIHYKLIKLYSICYIHKEEEKMPKYLKLVPSIILFVFVFLIIEEVVASNSNDPFDTIPTPIKCTSTQDCPDIISQPNVMVSFCIDGYCHKLLRS